MKRIYFYFFIIILFIYIFIKVWYKRKERFLDNTNKNLMFYCKRKCILGQIDKKYKLKKKYNYKDIKRIKEFTKSVGGLRKHSHKYPTKKYLKKHGIQPEITFFQPAKQNDKKNNILGGLKYYKLGNIANEISIKDCNNNSDCMIKLPTIKCDNYCRFINNKKEFENLKKTTGLIARYTNSFPDELIKNSLSDKWGLDWKSEKDQHAGEKNKNIAALDFFQKKQQDDLEIKNEYDNINLNNKSYKKNGEYHFTDSLIVDNNLVKYDEQNKNLNMFFNNKGRKDENWFGYTQRSLIIPKSPSLIKNLKNKLNINRYLTLDTNLTSKKTWDQVN